MFKKHPKRRAAVIIIAAVFVLSLSIASFAKYIHSTGESVSELVPGEYQKLTINCKDSYDENGFYDLSLLSVSTEDKIYPLYIRVMINVTWQNEQGEVFGQQPIANKDYSLVFNDSDWFCDTNDGKYYCYTDVPVGGTTEKLIGKTTDQKLIQLRAAPAEGYKLKTEICAQAIQATGTTGEGLPAIEEAWGASPGPY